MPQCLRSIKEGGERSGKTPEEEIRGGAGQCPALSLDVQWERFCTFFFLSKSECVAEAAANHSFPSVLSASWPKQRKAPSGRVRPLSR